MNLEERMVGLIDSHCHLGHENFAPGDTPAAVMARARAQGIGGVLNICCRIHDEFSTTLSTARAFPDVWCTIGTHPHEAEIPAEQAVTVDEIVRLARSDPKIIGIGECGLDYFYEHSDRAVQQDVFRRHIQAAARTGLPLIIHGRDADEDLMRILLEEGAGRNESVCGVMHCFSGTEWLARQALDIGFYISFSGIMTFKKAESLRDIARFVPLDRIMVETDAPYLAPEPLRGKINEPAYVRHTVRALSALKNLSEEHMVNICNKNFFDLFRTAK